MADLSNPVVSVATGMLGALLFANAVRCYFQRKAVLALTRTPVADVRPGLVEVVGRIEARGKPLVSPWGQERCVHFQLEVEERRGTSKNKNWWTIIKDKQFVPALVRDATGEIAVELERAHLQLARDRHTRSGVWDSPSPELKDLMARYGRSTRGWVFEKTLRYEERVLECGDEVYVIGQAVQRDGRMVITSGGPFFAVSDQGEKTVLGQRTLYAVASLLGALVAFAVAVVAFPMG